MLKKINISNVLVRIPEDNRDVERDIRHACKGC